MLSGFFRITELVRGRKESRICIWFQGFWFVLIVPWSKRLTWLRFSLSIRLNWLPGALTNTEVKRVTWLLLKLADTSPDVNWWGGLKLKTFLFLFSSTISDKVSNDYTISREWCFLLNAVLLQDYRPGCWHSSSPPVPPNEQGGGQPPVL